MTAVVVEEILTPEAALQPEEEPPAPPVAKAKLAAPQRRVGNLKLDVLDQLGRYQVYAKRLRKRSPSLYAQYRRIGAYLLPQHVLADAQDLEPSIVQRLPAFGAIALGMGSEILTTMGDDGLPLVPPRFVCFEKVNKPGSWVERSNWGVTYRCVAYFDDKDDKIIDKLGGAGVVNEYFVSVSPDGEVKALRVLKTEHQIIRHKRQNRGRTSVVYHQRWGLPDCGSDSLNAAKWIRFCFTSTMNFWLQAARGSMVRITATKDGLVMPFVIDPLDIPAFFRDRETITDENGHKKRIFHVVRPHVREGAQRSGVRLHFRGLREFDWNGYQIAITVPGKSHVDLADADFGTEEFGPDEEIPDGMELLEVASDRIADAIGAPA